MAIVIKRLYIETGTEEKDLEFIDELDELCKKFAKETPKGIPPNYEFHWEGE